MAVNVPPTNAVGPPEPTSRPVSIAQAPMVSRTARTVRGWGARSQAQVANHPPTSPADAPPIVESNPLHPRSLATLSRRGARPGPPAEDAYAPPVRRVLALLAAVAMVVASLVIRARLDRNQGVGGRVLRLTFPSLAVRRRFTYRARWTRKGPTRGAEASREGRIRATQPSTGAVRSAYPVMWAAAGFGAP
jgi:hypothetical protein